MARVRLDLDTETFGRLVDSAIAERRPVDMQAEIVLMRALGTQPAAPSPISNVLDEAVSDYQGEELASAVA